MSIWNDILGLFPILNLSSIILIAIVLKTILKKSELAIFYISIFGLIVSLMSGVLLFEERRSAFSDMILVGGYANYFIILIALIGILFLLQTYQFIKSFTNYSEYLILSLSAILGMMVMSASIDLVTIFIGLELMSISFYILAGFNRTDVRSNESSLKYFLLGAFATGFFLYGIALVYGATGSTNLLMISQIQSEAVKVPIYIIGFVLLLIGFGFKVAAVPFHMWVPDVYEGAPTLSTSIMATGGKIAAFSSFMLAFSIPLSMHLKSLTIVVAILAASSMIVGNIFGLAQKSLKRMLAYSSIAHAGYMLVGMASGTQTGREGIAFYLMSYALTNLGAFGVIIFLENKKENLTYENIAGLGKTQPFAASMLAIFMISLIGIPPFAGFIGKYYLFLSAIEQNMTWLAIIGVVTSVVSLYYYLRVVVYIYFKESEIDFTIEKSKTTFASLLVSAALILFFGIVPSLILRYTHILM